MKKNIYSIVLASAAMMALAGCESEATFFSNPEEGQLNCKALSVDYINSGTRATNVDVNEFTVNFINEETGETVRSYQYSSMPEIVSLPAGKYRAEASYGDNEIAALFDNPVYEGASSFVIEKGKITDDVDPIECSLQNMKIDVDVVDQTGMEIVGSDVKVVVKAGKNGQLTYDSERMASTGFFKFEDGSKTIVAELSGTLDGVYTDGITRTYQDAGTGKAYKIRFNINRPDNVNDGDINIGDGVQVDATIEIKDENFQPIDPNDSNEGESFIDDMRPTEDPIDPEPGTKPDPGTDPEPGKDPDDKPTPSGEAPKAISTCDIVFDQPCDVDADTQVTFTVTSDTGITAFKIYINSETLGADLLEGVGLGADLDLVNPGKLKEGLEGLGFPTGDDVRGKTSVDFDISGFMELLGIYGAANHKFEMTISDANGTTETTLWLVTK
ncbi:MAG: DUF4493 domain-containing protein [Bacteroides sp.]|nr:DUF4493 domain-containing protein [Bacteroides sp.]